MENNRVYGSVEDVRKELEGTTGFDKDIEDDLISRIAEIEQNDGVVPGLNKTDLGIMGVITAIGIILFVTVFVM